jgi:hypothetical protein
MVFIIQANAEFEANDIDDAFIQLARYFNSLGVDELENFNKNFIISGSIEINKGE